MAGMQGPSVLGLVGDLTGPSWWRVLQPFRALQAQGYPAEWEYTTSALTRALSTRFDAVLLPRLSWPPSAHAVAAAWVAEHKAAGRLILYDCDDDLFTAGAMHRLREVWKPDERMEQLDAERYERIWALQQADGVTVSTVPLARIVASFTAAPVHVVPNAIDVSWLRGVVRGAQRRTAYPTIGWAGGKRHDADLAPVAEAWRRIAARYPTVTFVVQGHAPPIITDAVPPDRLVVIPWMSLDRYPLGLMEVDIACCSVSADRWNQNKSGIKAYEAAIAGAAVVASPTVYGELIEHEHTGYLAETADEWDAGLSALIARPALRAIMATRLRKRVERQHSLKGELWRWPAAWSAIQEDARARRGRLVAV